MTKTSNLAGTGELAHLLGVTTKSIADLAKRGIVVRGSKRGTYDLEASVSGYCEHLRAMAAGRGGDAGVDARARLGAAQATLAETKAKQLAGELVEASEVEAFWRSKLKAFRNRILAVPGRVKGLQARQSVTLAQELRAALTELADDTGH
jgi:phage terminase Nu1 subunit (DNA packaging protein)